MRSAEQGARPMLNGNIENFGYGLLGPYLVDFCIWLRMRKQELDGDACLLFLARDGYLIQKIYRILFPEDAEVAHYVLASRATNRYAELETEEKILKFYSSLAKANQESEALLTIYRFLGQPRLLRPQSPPPAPNTKGRFSRTDSEECRWPEGIKDLLPHIIARSEQYRSEYRRYLDATLASRYPIVVDIGYRAKTQQFFSKLLNTPVGGFYLVTHKSAKKVARESGPITAFDAGFIAPDSSESFVNRHRYFFEVILSEQRGTFHYFDKDSSPVYDDFVSDPRSRTIGLAIERGVMRYAMYFRRLGNPQDALIEARDKLKAFLDSPHADDAVLFTGLTFDDRFNGITQRYVVIPPAERQQKFALWVQGQQAIDVKCRSTPMANANPGFCRKVEIIIMDRLLTRAHFACYMSNRSLYTKQNGGVFYLLFSAFKGFIKRAIHASHG
ncbi:hypothetical protein ABK249_20770 [Neorhizobium sp. Rsf11]|uniref:Uncharacterized protein n=1 Tax=Neorhizobium phenanthreniclasticum TaxID=3157917 RepID=A0ABV0M686_9HYPH